MLNFIYQYMCNIFDKLFKVKIEPYDYDVVSDVSWNSLYSSTTDEI